MPKYRYLVKMPLIFKSVKRGCFCTGFCPRKVKVYHNLWYSTTKIHFITLCGTTDYEKFCDRTRITKGSQFATLFLFIYLLNTAQFKKALLEWRNILHFAPKDNVNVGRLPSAGVHAYASGGAHAVGCRF